MVNAFTGRAIRTVGLIAAASFLQVAGGCGSVPNVSAFATQTKAIESQYQQVATGVTDEIRRIDRQHADKFKIELSKRARLLRSTTVYSEELVRLAEVAQPGSTGADKLAGAVTSIASSFEVVIPGPFSKIATEVLDFIENVAARRTLANAIESADPAIKLLANVLGEEMQPLIDLTRQTKHLVLRDLKDGHKKIIDEYRSATNQREQLVVKYRDRLATLPKDELTLYRDRLALIEGWLTTVESRDEWADYTGRASAIDERYEALEAVMVQVRLAAQTWAVTHGELAAVVRQRGSIDVELLTTHARNIHGLIKEIKTP